MSENLLVLLIVVPTASIIFLVTHFLMKRKGKKERWFDERYTNIHRYGRSFSWMVTTFGILIGWIIVSYMEGASLAFFVFTGLWVAHMLSYMIGAGIANSKY